jgi:lipoprotein-releasing system permease protein
MTGRGFEWFVAWRHLRDDQPRSRRTLWAGVILLGLGGLALGADRLAPRLHGPFMVVVRNSPWFENLKMVGVGAVTVGLLAFTLGVLFAIFTVFTAFSMFGVLLGTGAPIIALSIMSGFELDLKSKIRATKADVVIARADDQPFTDWRPVQTQALAIAGVAGAMPYLESEVIVKHVSNPAGMGILLRGIETGSAGRVLDLARTLKEGGVDLLEHPERIPTDRNFDLPEVEEPASPPPASPPPPRPSGPRSPPPKVAGAARTPAPRSLSSSPPSSLRPFAAPPPEPSPRPAGRVLPGILLGEELFAHTLRVYLGGEVDVACPLCGVGPTGPMPRLKTFRVAGHFYSGMYEFDSKLAYVSLAEAQKFLGQPGEVTGIDVRTMRPDTAVEIARVLGQRLGPAYEVRSWEELNRSLFMALRLEKLAMFIVLTFIALVASFSIVSNLIMMVTEKGREVAILKSMGASDGGILRVFFAEGLYIGLVGLALGLLLGIGTCVLIGRFGLPLDPDVYYIQKLPVVMRVSEIGSVAAAALGLCCLATLYPAFLASRMRPVDGLRYE